MPTHSVQFPVTVLLLEDFEADRVTYRRYLEADTQATYHLLEATTLAAGRALWRSHRPAVLLVDVSLPDGNGLDLLAELEPEFADGKLPVIVLSGQGNERVAVQAMKLGAADYLVKEDITAAILQETVHRVYHRAVLQRRLLRSHQQAAIVSSIALRVRQSLQLDKVLNATVQEVREFLAADRVVVHQFDPADMSGTVVAEAVLAPWGSCLGNRIVDTCFQSTKGSEYAEGRIFAVADIHAANLSACHLAMLEPFQVRANLVVPILCPNAEPQPLWGLLVVQQCGAVRYWEDTDIRLLQQLSVQLAIAIQQAELYESLQRLNTALEQKVEDRTQELQASRNRFLGIFENMFQFIGLLSPDGTLLEANQTALQFAGVVREAVINRPFWEAPWWQISPETQAQLRGAIARAAEGEFVRYEVDVWGVNQAVVPIDFSLRPVRDEAGQVVLLIPEGRDLSEANRLRTEREQAFKLLQASERRYASLAAVAPVGIFRTDHRGYCTYVNDRYCEITGLTLEAAVGEGWRRGLHPEDRAFAIAEWEQSVRENRFCQLECRFRHPDGTVRWVYVQSAANRDGNGQIIEYVGTITDISDRKRAEAALRQSEAQSRAILAAIPDLMVRIGADGTYRGFVARRLELDLLRTGEVTGRPLGDILPPELSERKLHHLRQALETGELQVYEQQVQIGDRLQYEEVRAIPYNADEVLFIIRDISDRKRMEAERLQAAKVRQELRLLEAILDVILAGYWDWDIPGNRIYLSPGFKRMFGYAPEELTDSLETWQSLVVPEDFAKITESFERHIQSLGAIPHANEVRYRHKDGSLIWVMCSGQVIDWDAAGQPLRMIGCHVDISDRKQVEAQLEASEAQFRRLVEGADEVVWSAGVSGKFLYLSPRFESLFGWHPREWIGQSFTDLIHPADRPGILAQRQELFETASGPHILEFRHRHRAGHYVWVRTSITPFRNGAGEILGLQGILSDISDLKRAEQQLQESQNKFQRLVEDIGDKFVVFSHDPFSGALTYVSNGFESVFGLSKEAAIGQPWMTVIDWHSEDLVAEIAAVEQMVHQDLMTHQAEVRFWHPNGSQRTLHISDHVVRDSQGQIIAIEGIAEDISDRKRTEQVIQESRAFYRAIIADQTELICRFLPDGTLTFVNDAFCKFFQKQPEELLGERFDRLLPDADREIAEYHLTCLSVENPVVTYEHRVVAPDGTLHWQQWTNRALFNADHYLTEFQAVGRNITDLKEAEAQLRNTNEELIRATRLKDEFLANMSHELRTPLNAILGMSESLQEEIFGEINDQQLNAVQTIERSGTHLLALINDVLNLAKIESGHLELEQVPTDLTLLCQSSLAFIKQEAIKKQIQLQTRLPPQLPTLHVDERRMRQVLINLLNNAVKFTPEGGGITLAVEWLPQVPGKSSFVRLSVQDTGIGIAPENLRKLFQPFVQIDSALNRKYEGTGLGLALVKRIVDLHGGQVSVTSEVGVGSCFIVDLPWVAAPDQADVAPALQAEVDVPDSETSPLILLAEDNEANIAMMTSYLEMQGYRLMLANNGYEAVQLAQAHQPDLILMDIQMPDLDGLQATQQIRQQATLARVPIIALTALAMEGDRDRCLAAGATEYFSKPVKLKQLVGLIQRLLASPR